jgi:hypothetical protein
MNLSAKERSSFLKKEAKNFCLFWLRLCRIGSTQTNKSFLVFFSKKNCFVRPNGMQSISMTAGTSAARRTIFCDEHRQVHASIAGAPLHAAHHIAHCIRVRLSLLGGQQAHEHVLVFGNAGAERMHQCLAL